MHLTLSRANRRSDFVSLASKMNVERFIVLLPVIKIII